MWWWRRVRPANIPEDLRIILERYGEDALAHALAVGPRIESAELYTILNTQRAGVLAWLTERRDIAARREDRLETVEWAILIFVIIGVITDVLLLLHER